MPEVIKKSVVKHYVNKLTGRKSSSELMGAKNLFKLFRVIPGLQVNVEAEEYKLKLATKSGEMNAYARKYPSSDLITLLEVWGKNEYKDAIELLITQGNHAPNILDVGGNVGYSVLYFKNYFPQSKIICVEPDQANINQIQKNINTNHLNDIHIVEGALWRKRTKMELKNDFREGTSASFYVVESDLGSIEGYSMDDLFAIKNWDHVDLLKMDIEGAEKYLLEDDHIASSILTRTRNIAIEIHDDKADRNKIYQTLTSNGFTFFTKGDTTFGTKKK